MSTDRSTLVAFSDQLADAVAAGARSMVAVHGRLRLPSTGIHWRDGVVVTTEATVRRDWNIAKAWLFRYLEGHLKV